MWRASSTSWRRHTPARDTRTTTTSAIGGSTSHARSAADPMGRIPYTSELVAMFIYLNRTGFNGLFRLNARGAFNVPAGRYARPRIVDRAKLLQVGEALPARASDSSGPPSRLWTLGPALGIFSTSIRPTRLSQPRRTSRLTPRPDSVATISSVYSSSSSRLPTATVTCCSATPPLPKSRFSTRSTPKRARRACARSKSPRAAPSTARVAGVAPWRNI